MESAFTAAFPQPARRYRLLPLLVEKHESRTILEIGVWNGDNGARMIKAALRRWAPDEVRYFGFDLFEQLTDAKLEEEYAKRPPDLETVRRNLCKYGVSVELTQGDTRQTLPEAQGRLPKVDFIFVDGGHSAETVRSDWNCVESLMHDDTIVLFDDYWNQDGIGANVVVDQLDRNLYDVCVLQATDHFWLRSGDQLMINLVKVSRRRC